MHNGFGNSIYIECFCKIAGGSVWYLVTLDAALLLSSALLACVVFVAIVLIYWYMFCRATGKEWLYVMRYFVWCLLLIKKKMPLRPLINETTFVLYPGSKTSSSLQKQKSWRGLDYIWTFVTFQFPTCSEAPYNNHIRDSETEKLNRVFIFFFFWAPCRSMGGWIGLGPRRSRPEASHSFTPAGPSLMRCPVHVQLGKISPKLI